MKGRVIILIFKQLCIHMFVSLFHPPHNSVLSPFLIFLFLHIIPPYCSLFNGMVYRSASQALPHVFGSGLGTLGLSAYLLR
jgi:hypothetical protein